MQSCSFHERKKNILLHFSDSVTLYVNDSVLFYIEVGYICKGKKKSQNQVMVGSILLTLSHNVKEMLICFSTPSHNFIEEP